MRLAARTSDVERSDLDEYLLSGGDGRLALDPASGLNVYGCSVKPRGDGCDFSSSTASSISERAYRRVDRAWRRISVWRQPALFAVLADEARAELKTCLGLETGEADIVFSPSGTDAQLTALFLSRALLGERLVTVIVGSDQTGSGTAFTAVGKLFSDRGHQRKGAPIEGLSENLSSIPIPFCDASGRTRTLDELDNAVLAAVETQAVLGGTILLQAMAASKLGWAAPSAACIETILRRWPGRVQIVTDACQMRLGRDRLRHLLARGDLILMTGSKFFCGPPFSGALLVPGALRRSIALIEDVPAGLQALGNGLDWPSCWPNLRKAFSSQPNIGQWLRWQAALEEMRCYHEVPLSFRKLALSRFSTAIPALLAASDCLSPFHDSVGDPDPARDAEFAVPTIFPFFIKSSGRPLSFQDCADAYRRLNLDISSACPDADERQLASRRCHIGQPVAVGGDRMTVLRLSSSARLVVNCWSSDPVLAAALIEAEIAKAALVIQKCGLILRQNIRSAA